MKKLLQNINMREWSYYLSRYSFFIVFGLSIIISGVIYFYYQARAIVIWDEGSYLEQTWWLIEAMRSHDWNQFFALSKSYFQYPPLFNWLFLFPFYFIEPSIRGIRSINIIFYIIGTCLTYWLGSEIAQKRKRIVSFLAALLFLFSPLMITFTVILMREMVGTTFTLLVVILYFISKRKSVIYLLFTSVAFMALTMIKYNFGILAFGIMSVNEGIEFMVTKYRVSVFSRWCMITIPYLLFMFWWIILYQNQLAKFFFILRNPANYLTGVGSTLDHILFYPRAIMYLYSPSVLLGIGMLVTLVAAFLYAKNSRIRFLWLAVVINILLGMVHTENMQERYIFTVVPFVYCISAYVLVENFDKITGFLRKFHIQLFGYILGLLGLGVIGWELIHLPTYIIDVGSYTNKIALYNQKTFKELWFDYDRSHWSHPLAQLGDEKPEDVFRYIVNTIDMQKLTAYVGSANELSQPYRGLVFKELERIKTGNNFPYREAGVLVEILPDSKFYTRDYLIQNKPYLDYDRFVFTDPTWILYQEKIFHDLGVKVTIFAKP